MAAIQVRYIVHDVDTSIAFYCGQLGFQEVMYPAPAVAMLSRGALSASVRRVTDESLPIARR